MLLGPPYIIACPVCQDTAATHTYLSTNTFGATLWSDGFLDAPMQPQKELIARCERCEGVYAVAQAVPLGLLDSANQLAHPEWNNAHYIRPATIEDYRQALAEGMAESYPHREIKLRTRIWWLLNDPKRINPSSEPTTTECTENLAHLKGLLMETKNNDFNDQVTLAEVHRQLGEFNAAQSILEPLLSQNQKVIAQLLARVEPGETQLFRLEI